MKKHIFGFAIFSLIVGTAVLVHAFFSTPGRVTVAPVVETVEYTSPQKTSCWKMKKSYARAERPKLTVVQAVFDLNTKQMNWELATPQTENPIALHFYKKEAYGTRYLATEFLDFPAVNSYSAEKGVLEITSSFRWLDDFGSYQNLYVTAEQISRAEFDRRGYQPAFDADAATAVTLNSGETRYKTVQYLKK